MPLLKVGVEAVVEGADKFLSDARGINAAYLEFAKNNKTLKAANKDAAGALQTFGVNLNALNNPLTLIAGGLKSSIDYTIKWGDTIDELTRITGTSARETSKLAIVLGDMGISTDSLRGAAKALKNEGLVPNLETLKALAVQYQAIQDPVERTRFGIKNLGRSYFELSEFLTRDISNIDALGAAAEKSGKIIDEFGIAKAEAYADKTRQLTDKLDGAKLAVGGFAIDLLSKAVPAGEQYIGIWQALAIKVQLSTGMIDQNTASVQAAELAGLSHADALKQVYGAYELVGDESIKLRQRMQDEVEIGGTTIEMTKDQTSAWVNLYTTMDSTLAANTVLIEENKRAHEEMVSASILQAGLSGTLTNAEQAYNITIDDTQSKIDELNAKLSRLGDTQGQTVTVTKDATASQAELALAQDKVILSTEKLSVAQQKLSENTDPDKQFKLQMAVDSAAVALENAQAKAFNLGGEMGSLSTYTVNNTAKIAELHAELDPLIAKQEAAAVAARHATDEFIYQQLSAGLDADAAIKLAEALGLIDPASAAAATAAQALKAQYDSGKIGADEYASKANALADAINRLQDKSVKITQESIYIETHIKREQHEQGVGGPGGYQHGGSFTVPPGYENDTYRMGVSSGEHVVVTPARGGVGNVMNTANWNYSPTYGGSAPPSLGRDIGVMQALVGS